MLSPIPARPRPGRPARRRVRAPGREGGQGPALGARSFPGAPRTPASRPRAPRPAHGGALRGLGGPVHRPRPHRRTWPSEPGSERGGLLGVRHLPPAAIKGTDRLGRGWDRPGREARTGQGQARGSAANFPALTFLPRGPGWRGSLHAVCSLPPRVAGHRAPAAPSRALRGAASHVPRPLPARARVAAARGGGARARASSQPRSQRALRGPTRANPVTHPRRARSSLALPSHTLTPGSTWRRRRRRGTPTPGVRGSSGGRARALAPAGTNAARSLP